MVRHSAHIFPIRYPQQRGDLLLPETGGAQLQNTHSWFGLRPSGYSGHDHPVLAARRAAAAPRRGGDGGHPVPVDYEVPAAARWLTASRHPKIPQGSPQAFAPW